MNIIIEVERFLLNLAFIFMLYFFYHHYIEKSNRKYSNEIVLTIISGLSIILCMKFTVSPTPGHILDMRQLPFIIGALYGGPRVALALLVIAISYRFSLGFDQGFYASSIVYILLCSVLFYLFPRFKQAISLKRRLFIAISASLIWALLLLSTIYIFSVSFDSRAFLYLLSSIIAQFVGISVFIVSIEKTKKERLLIAELKKLEKLKIVSEIAASISHEVRNPLTVTKGFLQLLRDPSITEEKKLQYIRLSSDELKRAEDIINDYLTFAKPRLEKVDVLELNEEIDYIIKVLTPYATMNDLTIQFQPTDNLYIIGEAQKLHQALINVAKNGLEAMESGGVLIIKLKEEGEQAIITIKDTGTGMTIEQIERLGSPFYSMKEKGTGLGTMVVFSIIKVMNGAINVTSTLGKGTCFTISFPKAETKK